MAGQGWPVSKVLKPWAPLPGAWRNGNTDDKHRAPRCILPNQGFDVIQACDGADDGETRVRASEQATYRPKKSDSSVMTTGLRTSPLGTDSQRLFVHYNSHSSRPSPDTHAMLLFNLFRHSKDTLEIKAGEALMREGESGENMYVLIEGQALIEYRGMCFAEIGPGDFVGELAVIDHSPRMASVIARTDCRFVPINRKRFEYLVAETPLFSLEIMRVLAQRLRRTDELHAGREENSPSVAGSMV